MRRSRKKVAKGRGGAQASHERGVVAKTTVDLKPPLANRPDSSVALVHVLGLTTPCWRCGVTSTPLVAMIEESGDPFGEDLVLCDDEVILDFAWRLLPVEVRVSNCVGEVKIRSSKTTGTSYLSNGCSACGAIFGEFPLFHEDLPEALSVGFDELTVLASVRIPAGQYQAIFESRWAWDDTDG